MLRTSCRGKFRDQSFRWFRNTVVIILLGRCWFLVRSSESPKFYVYDWRDAQFNSTESAYASPEAKYLRAPGHGFEIDASRGFYDTWQFSLYTMIESRAKADKHRRTMNANLATTFIIPYDIGMDAMFARDSGKMRRTNCPHAGAITQRLLSSPYFQRSRGHNHLVILSIGQTMDYFLDAKNCKKFFSLCYNCTKLAVDDYSFTNRYYPRRHFLASRGNFWHAIPYPSNVHFNSRLTKPFPWEKEKEEKNEEEKEEKKEEKKKEEKKEEARRRKLRSTVVAIIGSYKTSHNIVSNRIASQLMESCSNTGTATRKLFSTAAASYSSIRSIHLSGNNSSSNNARVAMRWCESISPATQTHQLSHRAALRDLASRSIFCVIVPDDVPTRQAVFDSILQGCIPVFLDKLAAPLMYEWHWGARLWEKASVSLDEYKERMLMFHSNNNGNSNSSSVNNVNIVQILHDMYNTDRSSNVYAKQDIISKHAYQLQYSIVVVDATTSTSSSTTVTKAAESESITDSNGNIISHIGDAYDIAINATLAIHSGRRTHKRVSPNVICERMKKFRHGDICRPTNSSTIIE